MILYIYTHHIESRINKPLLGVQRLSSKGHYIITSLRVLVQTQPVVMRHLCNSFGFVQQYVFPKSITK